MRTLFFFVSIILTIFLTNCEKKPVSGEDLNGKWIATEKADTIYFMDDSNFYHSSENMRYDHYDYSISGDSILIGYSGKMMIMVIETNHYIELNGDNLTIDLSNRQCFGFPKEEMHYRRIQ